MKDEKRLGRVDTTVQGASFGGFSVMKHPKILAADKPQLQIFALSNEKYTENPYISDSVNTT